MTVRTVRLGGTDWADGDILYAADQNDTISAAVTDDWTQYTAYVSGIGIGLIRFSDSIFQTATVRTTTSGSGWNSGGFNAVAAEDIANASGVQGIAFDRSDGSASFCTDSGVTWAASSTQPANANTINAGHLFSTTVGACGGTAASGNYIWYTANGGDDWTQATTGPTAEVTAIVMASATVGYAVDTSGNIWKTTDAGINWADTTDNFSPVPRAIHAIDADTILSSGHRSPIVQRYINSTNSVATFNYSAFSSTDNSFTNWVTATNGNYYTLYWAGATTAGSGNVAYLNLFKFDGTSLFVKDIPLTSNTNSNSGWLANSVSVIPSLVEGADNILYVNISSNVIKIDVREG